MRKIALRPDLGVEKGGGGGGLNPAVRARFSRRAKSGMMGVESPSSCRERTTSCVELCGDGLRCSIYPSDLYTGAAPPCGFM